MIGQQNSRHFLNQWESKPKPIVFSPHAFSRVWRQLHVFVSNSDWLVMLFTSVAIDQSNYDTQLETALGSVPTNTEVFLNSLGMTMREKQIAARTIGIQRENWG